jgi:hypothetical protein
MYIYICKNESTLIQLILNNSHSTCEKIRLIALEGILNELFGHFLCSSIQSIYLSCSEGPAQCTQILLGLIHRSNAHEDEEALLEVPVQRDLFGDICNRI